MANFIVMCDLTGPYPSAREVETHLSRVAALRGRILATVWWVEYPGTAEKLCRRVGRALGAEDLMVVVEAKSVAWSRRDESIFDAASGEAA
jgi:hypothetical protein